MFLLKISIIGISTARLFPQQIIQAYEHTKLRIVGPLG